MAELTNSVNEFTIGIYNNEGVYVPVIMWNIEVKSYISEKDHPFRAYGCEVKIQGRTGDIKVFKVWIKEHDFQRFAPTRTAIVDQTHGKLIGYDVIDFVLL